MVDTALFSDIQINTNPIEAETQTTLTLKCEYIPLGIPLSVNVLSPYDFSDGLETDLSTYINSNIVLFSNTYANTVKADDNNKLQIASDKFYILKTDIPEDGTYTTRVYINFQDIFINFDAVTLKDMFYIVDSNGNTHNLTVSTVSDLTETYFTFDILIEDRVFKDPVTKEEVNVFNFTLQNKSLLNTVNITYEKIGFDDIDLTWVEGENLFAVTDTKGFTRSHPYSGTFNNVQTLEIANVEKNQSDVLINSILEYKQYFTILPVTLNFTDYNTNHQNTFTFLRTATYTPTRTYTVLEDSIIITNDKLINYDSYNTNSTTNSIGRCGYNGEIVYVISWYSTTFNLSQIINNSTIQVKYVGDGIHNINIDSRVTGLTIDCPNATVSEYAFASSSLTTVTWDIPQTTIPAYCFNNSKITTININQPVLKLGEYAFYGCSVKTLNNNSDTIIKDFGDYCLYGNSFTSFTYNSPEPGYIGEYAISNSSTLVNIYLNEDVNISPNAFRNNTKLATIYVSNVININEILLDNITVKGGGQGTTIPTYTTINLNAISTIASYNIGFSPASNVATASDIYIPNIKLLCDSITPENLPYKLIHKIIEIYRNPLLSSSVNYRICYISTGSNPSVIPPDIFESNYKTCDKVFLHTANSDIVTYATLINDTAEKARVNVNDELEYGYILVDDYLVTSTSPSSNVTQETIETSYDTVKGAVKYLRNGGLYSKTMPYITFTAFNNDPVEGTVSLAYRVEYSLANAKNEFVIWAGKAEVVN